MDRQCLEATWHSKKHAVALQGKDCTRLQICTDESGAFATRILFLSIICVCVGGIVLGFATMCRLTNIDDPYSVYLGSLLSKINQLISDVFSAGL